jgi:hypothetical protein
MASKNIAALIGPRFGSTSTSCEVNGLLRAARTLALQPVTQVERTQQLMFRAWRYRKYDHGITLVPYSK